MSIRLFRLGTIDLRINPLSIPIFLFFVCVKMTETLLVSMIALCFHEASHVLAAHRLGVKISYIELQPCGFCAYMQDSKVAFIDELAVAGAGVLFSIISGAITLSFMTITGFQSTLLRDFSYVSITLGVVNALPVLPLDGGRICNALLNILFSSKTAQKVSVILGIIISSAIIVSGVYGLYLEQLNFTVLIVGILMLLGTITQIKKRDEQQVKRMLRRSATITSGQGVGVCSRAIGADTGLTSVIAQFDMNRYNIVHVVDASLNTIGIVTENQVRTCAAGGGKLLSDVIKK